MFLTTSLKTARLVFSRKDHLYQNGLLATVIVFLTNIALIISSIYSNTLFLSVYPRNWLVYLLASQSLATLIFSFTLTSVLTKNIKKSAQVIFAFFILLFFASTFAHQHFNFYWTPFVISVFTGSVGSIAAVIIWNILPLAFGFREYKKIAVRAGQLSLVGIITGSFLIPLVLRYSSLDSLLYITIICFFGTNFSIHFLVLLQQSTDQSKFQTKKTVWEYPYLKKIIWFTFLLVLTQVLIEYVFKIEAATYFTKKDLAEFFGYYTGISNFLALILGVTTTNYLLKYFRLDGLLYATQFLTLLGCLLVVIFPSLWTIALLASVKIIFYYNYTVLAIEILLNILPSAVRVSGKFLIKTIISPITTLGIYLSLLLVVNYIHKIQIIIFTGLMILPTIWLVRQIINGYKTTLEHEAEFRRFNIVDELTPANASFFEAITNKALLSNDNNIVSLGLALFEKIGSEEKKLPESFYRQLKNSDDYVKINTITLIKKTKDEKAIPFLKEQLSYEKNWEIIFRILNVLSQLDPNFALKTARKYFQEKDSVSYPASIRILLTQGTSEEIARATDDIHLLTRSADPIERKKAAYIINSFQAGSFVSDLSFLISDTDDSVSEIAIHTSVKAKLISLAPEILNRIAQGKTLHSAKKVIPKFGIAIIPLILEKIIRSKNPSAYIKLLVAIPGKEAERALLVLINREAVFNRTLIAKEINYRACQQSISDTAKKQMGSFFFLETQTILALNNLLQQFTTPATDLQTNKLEKNSNVLSNSPLTPSLSPLGEGDVVVDTRNTTMSESTFSPDIDLKHYIVAEILSRIDLAKQRALYWLAIFSDTVQINKLIPSLLKSDISFSNKQEKAKALELLEIYLNDISLFQEVITIFESPFQKTLPSPANSFSDTWLTRVIQSQTNLTQEKNMDLLLKVFNLRQIELFKNLPGETLLAIAEETKQITFDEGETIFQENDFPDGLYCIISGNVKITRQGKTLNVLGEHNYFGELGLIDDAVRSATAIAESDCSLLFLDKSTFDRITDDLPEVLRVVTQVILRYLRQNLERSFP